MEVENLIGKRILLFTPQGKGIYGTAIFNELETKGAYVSIYNERPSTSNFIKLIYRVAKKLLRFHFSKYIRSIIEEVKTIDFDYVLIIRGEAFSAVEIKMLRNNFSNAKFILYLWDSLKNCDTRRLFPYFDRILSFDLEDCNKHTEMLFRPLFFSSEYEKIADFNNYEYDLIFIGTVHSDRLFFLRRIEKYLQLHNFKSFTYLYFPSRLLFWRKKITDKNFRGYSVKDFNYKMIPAKRVSELLAISKVSLDMQAPTQSGLTMRTIEVLGAKRKLITTNKQIKHYDFYNPTNILVVDMNFKELDVDFLKTPFRNIETEVYQKYSLNYWIDEVFGTLANEENKVKEVKEVIGANEKN